MKVKSTKINNNREDVYCMEVEGTHCFALSNGVIAHNCCGHDLQKLLNEGFNGVAGRVGSKAPKHVREALYQMANFIGILQAEWAGAQAFSSFDTYLAPLVFFDMHYGTLNYDELKKAVRNFVFNLNVPSRWGQSPFSNVTIDLKCPNDLKDRNPMRENLPFFVSVLNEYKETIEKVRAAIKEQGIGTVPEGVTDKEMEVFMSWEILMTACHDRLAEFGEDDEKMDDETLCYSMCYKHFDKEMKLISRTYYEVLNEGDAFGLPFTFPIPTLNIGEDFDWENPDYDVIWENTAKYGSSYFQNFIGSQYLRDENGELTIRDENAYSPNDVRSMCCRLQLDKRALRKRGGGLFGSDSQTGSIGVVTINLARIGYNFKGDMKGYMKQLFKLMDMAKSTLEKKRAFVTEMVKRGLYPYTRRYVNSALNGFTTYFSTIGVNGMNESIRNFTNDEHNIADEWGQKFALDVMDKVRERLLQYQEETGNLYNLEASPGEGCLRGDTLILTNEGEWSKISDLAKEGTANLLSFNRKTGKTEVKPAKVFLDSVSSKHYVIGLKNGLVIECTTEHPFAVVNGDGIYWSPASALVAGDVIKGLTQDMEVVSIGIVEDEMPVYNATVEDNENFYMGDEEHGFILTHNTTYRFAKEDAKRFGDKEVQYIICEKHGRVEVVTDEDEIECPLCANEKNND